MSKDNESIDFSLVLASSVHDMKNSIGMLVASLEGVVADMPPQDSTQKKRFNTLHYEASRINSELVQLLTIYRMQNEFLPVRIDEHYVVDMLEDQVARNHMLIETGDLLLTLDCDKNLNWYYDTDLVGSVVHNVIVNCARYTTSKIRVSAAIDNEYLCVSLEDDGPGYPPHMLLKPVTDIDDGQHDLDSTHLGLYFAEKIAATHRAGERKGYIKLENGGSLGGGVFRIFVP